MPKSGSIDRNAPLTWPIVWHKILLEQMKLLFYNILQLCFDIELLFTAKKYFFIFILNILNV